MRVLAIDQGTTNTKALVVDEAGRILARAAAPSTSAYPKPGWAEQSAEGIWTATRSVIDAVAREVGPDSIDALAISNQRETVVAWDAGTGEPVGPAILWQCTRTAGTCAGLISDGHGDAVRSATGLDINPMFPAPKIAWVVANRPEARALHEAGRLRVGTVDAWLLWKLTGGARFATDHSNASRTQLFDTSTLAWSADLGAIFDAPVDCLPDTLPSDSRFGETAERVTALPAGVPIQAMMGDSHAALYGHGVRMPGVVKATYGTGSSLMTLTPERVTSTHGVSGTIAWSAGGRTHHALEGNIFVSAQAAAFMGGLLGVGDARALSDLAQTVDDAGGVSFVPALSGLGAPHWDERATGTISGITHATAPAHLARATFEAIALQICDVFEAMEADIGQPLAALSADGGATANGFLMQLQADLLGRPVDRSEIEEVGALGAAAMAFEALGTKLDWRRASTRFEPAMDAGARNRIRTTWAEAMRHVKA
jgi:glycerol kinase